ncbi:M56 family metallopeptidase [Pedobacter paludis]|uniref:TonB C-terminal domain-containing protein n=1 Tax=Pedobacter paludis TaxID=2203212 RepID=A0A317EZ18_9SPHI|nr:M56 family metallopeptidase [Pedobacter paludis]PWS32084.1 hypothetical protein DF947_09925 [Pedobacter paludis]
MSFAHYLLQVNLYLIVFYGFYKLLLDKETYFTLNRIYLVAAGVLSLCIPFIRLEWLTEQKAAQQVYASVNWDAVLAQATIITENNSRFSWGSVLVSIYCAGILFFLGRLVFNLFAVKKLIKNAKSGSAFSFFSKKIIDKELPQMDVIDIHEEAHIKQWHTLDILFFEILGILTWLNPVIYLYKKAIKNIHEFLADEMAADFQGDKAEYALLILSKSFGISPNSLTNGFFDKSLIKKRIFMLHKERSKKTAVVKYGIFIPLFAILIVFSSATIRKNEKLISITDQIPMEKPIELVQNIVSQTDPVVLPASKTIVKGETDANWKGFYNFLSKNINYPTEAKESNLQGNTQIKFTLKNGRINNLSSSVDLGEGCDEEVMKAILSYKGYKTIPNGKYALKVSFAIADTESKFKNNNIESIIGYQDLSNVMVTAYNDPVPKIEKDDDKVYDFVSIEKQPEFPGGIKKFYEYLGKAIKYPELAIENNVQGKVFLSFNVEKNGDLTDIKITRGLGSGTDEEAIRVLTESPKWYPGIQNGQAVRVKYNINVNFTLANDKPTATEKTAGVKIPIKFDGVPLNSATAPLIVVDGVKLSNNMLLNTINPNDIESISVLKDQLATNSYGFKAKNGVILVTTKQAKNNLFKKLEGKELIIEKAYDQGIR